jgi:hypothetical protein
VRRPASVIPPLARLTSTRASTSRGPSASPSTRNPATAAAAGSRLMRMPNTWVGIRRSAASSRPYEMTDDSSATPEAASSRPGGPARRRRRGRRTAAPAQQRRPARPRAVGPGQHLPHPGAATM